MPTETIPAANFARGCQPGSDRHFRQVIARWETACQLEEKCTYDELGVIARDLTAAREDAIALTQWMVSNHLDFRTRIPVTENPEPKTA